LIKGKLKSVIVFPTVEPLAAAINESGARNMHAGGDIPKTLKCPIAIPSVPSCSSRSERWATEFIMTGPEELVTGKHDVLSQHAISFYSTAIALWPCIRAMPNSGG
jgi:hypothetical protein